MRLGLASAAEVAAAYRQVEAAMAGEMIGMVVQAMAPPGIDTVVEVVQDELFGPLVAFGTGGIVGELLHDRAFRALPLSDLDARELITSVRAAPCCSVSWARPAPTCPPWKSSCSGLGASSRTFPSWPSSASTR